MRNNPGAYTTVGMNAAAVKVQTNRQTNASTGEPHIWLTLVDELHGAGGEGYAAARISMNATDVTDLVNLARRIDRAVAELVLAEYPDPGLTVDAPAFEVPEALAEAAPGATFVPIEWADLAVGDWLIDSDGDACHVLDPPDADGNAHVEYHNSASGRLMRYHPISAYVASCWRQVPGSPEDLA
jgi:hypothetical protein